MCYRKSNPILKKPTRQNSTYRSAYATKPRNNYFITRPNKQSNDKICIVVPYAAQFVFSQYGSEMIYKDIKYTLRSFLKRNFLYNAVN